MALPEIADVLIGQNSGGSPGKQVAAVEFDKSIGAGIGPRADPGAMQGGEMRSTSGETTKIAGKSADVISAAHRQSQLALAREIVFEPARFVEINLRWG